MSRRDFREETALNSAEFSLLRNLAGQLGLSKSAAIRYCILQVGNNFMQKRRIQDTEEATED